MLASIDVKISSSFACVSDDSGIPSLEDLPQRSLDSSVAICRVVRVVVFLALFFRFLICF